MGAPFFDPHGPGGNGAFAQESKNGRFPKRSAAEEAKAGSSAVQLDSAASGAFAFDGAPALNPAIEGLTFGSSEAITSGAF